MKNKIIIKNNIVLIIIYFNIKKIKYNLMHYFYTLLKIIIYYYFKKNKYNNVSFNFLTIQVEL